MGILIGHLLVGSIFLFFGLWWTTNILKRYFRVKHSGAGSFTNSCFYPMNGRIPVEEYISLVLGFGFIPGEFFVSSFHIHPHSYQHIAMTLGLGLAALVSLMERKKWFVPPGSNYVFMGWAHAIAGLLMYCHAHRNVPVLEQLMHSLGVLVLWALALSYFLELALPNQVLAGLGRAYLNLLLGIWWCHGAYLLYPDPWTTEIMKATELRVMMMPVVFALDCFLAIGVVVLSGMVLYGCIRRETLSAEYQKVLTCEQIEESSAFI